MNTAKNLTTIAENQEKVFEEGKKSEYDRFWDSCQDNGNLTNYAYGFSGKIWNDGNFYPKYDMFPTSVSNMFYASQITDLKQRLIDCGVVLNTENVANLYYFGANSDITHCPEIGHKNIMNAQNCFNGATNLETIDKITVGDGCSMDIFAGNALKLKNITFCENFAPKNLKLSFSELTKDSLLNLINNLADKSEDTSYVWKVTLSSTNLANLTDAEKAIATEKGWTLA